MSGDEVFVGFLAQGIIHDSGPENSSFRRPPLHLTISFIGIGWIRMQLTIILADAKQCAVASGGCEVGKRDGKGRRPRQKAEGDKTHYV